MFLPSRHAADTPATARRWFLFSPPCPPNPPCTSPFRAQTQRRSQVANEVATCAKRIYPQTMRDRSGHGCSAAPPFRPKPRSNPELNHSSGVCLREPHTQGAYSSIPMPRCGAVPALLTLSRPA
ncbi:hypothetical protein IQ07DRAFT_122945 [Pyrenochaeta sp. DS3sAY3a]|nr:hypothetical protein IQ07DRAFT_122945 [Pyrenochaeta sp. DS3sAY3a]